MKNKYSGKAKPIRLPCDFCGKEFDFLYGPKTLTNRKTHCCSYECAGKLQSKRKSTIQRTIPCEYCHKLFEYKGTLARFAKGKHCCSVPCLSHLYEVVRTEKKKVTDTLEWKLWRGAKKRADASNGKIPFRLALSDIPVIPAICPVLGIPLIPSKGQHSSTHNSPSLDRIFPALGYVSGNIRVISLRANRLKNNGTAAELMMVAQDVARLETAYQATVLHKPPSSVSQGPQSSDHQDDDAKPSCGRRAI